MNLERGKEVKRVRHAKFEEDRNGKKDRKMIGKETRRDKERHIAVGQRPRYVYTFLKGTDQEVKIERGNVKRRGVDVPS